MESALTGPETQLTQAVQACVLLISFPTCLPLSTSLCNLGVNREKNSQVKRFIFEPGVFRIWSLSLLQLGVYVGLVPLLLKPLSACAKLTICLHKPKPGPSPQGWKLTSMSLHLGDSLFCGMQIFSYCDLLFVTTIESYCSYFVPFVLLLPYVQKQKPNPTVPIAKSQLPVPLCPTGMSYCGPTEGGIQFCQRSQRSVDDQVTPSHQLCPRPQFGFLSSPSFLIIILRRWTRP